MGLKTAISLLRNPDKVVGVIKKVQEVITKVKPTLGLEKTKKYKESIQKVINKAKIARTQKRIDTYWKNK
jgi:hypothetical protein